MKKLIVAIICISLFAGCKKTDDGNGNSNVTVIPLTPTELKATVISSSQVDLSWTDKSTNEDGFKIQRKTGNGNFEDVGTVGKDVVNYSDNGLTANTTYTYRVYAFNSVGNSLGYTNEATVTTIVLPIITTTEIKNITATSASGGGNITSDAGSPVTARGICWSTSSGPTVALSTKTTDGTGIGSFTSNITGLTANTTYFVRAYATNTNGTAYGNEVSFSTTAVDITTGLVGYWPFNGNANDESGNGNNGTVNGASLTTDRFGNVNKAYSFDGVNDYIQCLQGGPTGNPSSTVTFWVKTNTSKSGHIFSYGGNGVSGGDYRILINPYVACTNSIAIDNYNSGIAYSVTFQNVWDFYTVTYNGNLGNNLSYASIYRNGILLNNPCFNLNNVNTNFLGNYPITFGKYHGTIPTDFLNASLDEIRIYNRVLTQEEITYLYNN